MFRGKNRYLKRKRQLKKDNNNKEDTKGPNHIIKRYYRGCFYGRHKAIQQYINNKFGIKVHTCHITNRGHVDNSVKISNTEPFDEKIDGHRFIGNITEDKLNYVLNHVVENSQIALDECRKHDKTRWNMNKEKTKSKQRDRDLKNDNLIQFDTI
jgi:hypothetical protein